jgi:recombinational DNA repair ATPase RecF
MRFETIRVLDYKCFADSQTIDLAAGLNVVTGTNNGGKTALLEAMSLTFQLDAHRSLRTLPRKGIGIEPHSRLELSARRFRYLTGRQMSLENRPRYAFFASKAASFTECFHHVGDSSPLNLFLPTSRPRSMR